jgi:hypothetical protein
VRFFGSSENYHSNQNYDLSDKNFIYYPPKGDKLEFYQSEKISLKDEIYCNFVFF